MDLTLDRPGNHLYIRSISSAGIQVGEHVYTGPLILSSSRLIDDWPATDIAMLDDRLLEPILQLAPEVVLFGTGDSQVFPDPVRLMPLYRHEVGVEIMATAAACRTFNVLVSEQRKVVAALLPLTAARP